MRKAAKVYVGASGWYYDHWEGVLYPLGLPKAQRLGVYAHRYNSVFGIILAARSIDALLLLPVNMLQTRASLGRRAGTPYSMPFALMSSSMSGQCTP